MTSTGSRSDARSENPGGRYRVPCRWANPEVPGGMSRGASTPWSNGGVGADAVALAAVRGAAPARRAGGADGLFALITVGAAPLDRSIGGPDGDRDEDPWSPMGLGWPCRMFVRACRLTSFGSRRPRRSPTVGQ